jgi:3-dehydroquinate synthase
MSASAAPLLVASSQGDYAVEPFGDIASLVAAVARLRYRFAIVDEQVATLYREAFAAFADAPLHVLAATEAEKTLQGVERALLALQAAGGNKNTTIVAVGGGITQDVATLAAHLWYRGVPYVYVPTTLLAMADSCIGAKCAVNLGAFKNQLGTFQSPQRVLVCERFIDTLADDDVRSGYGEIVKLAIVESAAAFAKLRADVTADGFRGPSLSSHVRSSLETKRRIIEIDEHERDLRRILNFGHTFGHALESVTHHAVPHGLAVVWGMDVANFIAWRRGLLARKVYEEVHAFIAERFAYRGAGSYDAAAIFAAMTRDKKASGGRIALILAHALGDVRVVPSVLDARLEADIRDYVRAEDVFAA